MVKVNDTVYRVSAVNYDTNVLTVAIISAADANHADDSTVQILANASTQGADYTDNDYTPKAKRSNVTQIFRDYIKMTGTQLAVQQYVKENVFVDEVQRET